ncbi:MAG: oxygen-independent coproporphyrinogen III oxidase [Alphaproteobacteria bacterium]|nr:oxygen-independent coproporphyrinogen III oxidase [Alphaproteobacteria bacterium]
MSRFASYMTMAVPRYTSYPTVPHFSDAVDGAGYAAWLEALDPAEPVSLYLHVPFCRQVCWYCGCNMKLAARYEPVADYVATLIREIELVADRLPGSMTVSHLHWGGGTPTAMEADDLARVMDVVFTRFGLAPNAERAIECDPRTLAPDMVKRIGALGFTRASFGVQEFDPRVQRAINRIQPPEMVADAVSALRGAGVSGVNFDLIYGLPHQTRETIARTVERCAVIGPDRLALFGYAHVPWMARKQRLIREDALPGAGERLAQAREAGFRLRQAGYDPVGLDHFARPHDDLAVAARDGRLRRNFQGYTTDAARTLIGFGATSIGRTPSGYVQNCSETGQWAREVSAGRLPVAKGHTFTGQDRLRGAAIGELMCNGCVDLDEIGRRHDAPAWWWFEERESLDGFVADGLIVQEGSRITVKSDASHLVRVVASVFDTYLAGNAARHSVAV